MTPLAASMKLRTANEIAHYLGGEVIGDGSVVISGFAAADQAKAGDLTFAENESYFARAEQSAAAAILVSNEFSSTRKPLIRVQNARIAFARVLPIFFPEPTYTPGIHPTAVVAKSAQVDSSAYIGPHCVVEEGVKIGLGTVLVSSVHIGAQSQLGERCFLFPRVTIYAGSILGARVRIHAGTVIGSDGFGYVLDEGQHLKVPQIGNVILQDDVEIGANTTIDRAALGSTIIGRGTKIDNLVQVAHNVVIGEHSILVAQVGVAGSTRLGSFVTLAGQAGIAGHLRLGNHVTVSAQSGVMHDIPDGEKWLGAPAQPDRLMKRIFVALQRLPELIQRVTLLEKHLGKTDPLRRRRGNESLISPPGAEE